jgi:uncharacterized membrane-anchored protein YhcB (DUF1043 family)
MADKNTNRGEITINKWVASGFGALALFVILHTGVLIWTLGSITTTQQHIQDDLAEIKQELKEATNDRYYRADASSDFAEAYQAISNLRLEFIAEKNRQDEIDQTIWESIHELQNKN